MGTLSRARDRAMLTLGSVLALGAGARLWYAVADGPFHPDEYFQYLEPAWWHLRGVGLEAWEWREALRSWILPFYNGAWMALLLRLGIERGATIGLIIKLHWALINVALIGIAFRGGASVTRRLLRVSRYGEDNAPLPGYPGGLVAAALCAGFAPLVLASGHTLSEMPSMLCLLAGLVRTVELTEDRPAPSPRARMKQAAIAGALLSFGACLRIANAPLALVPALWLLCRRDMRGFSAMALASLPPILLFGLADLLTWGTFAASFVNYLKFNLVEGRAAQFGTSPAFWYVERLYSTAPIGLPLLGITALLGLRGSAAFVFSASLLVAYLSTQPHKESRFLIEFWPLLMISAGGTWGAWIDRVSTRHPKSVPLVSAATLMATLLVIGDSTRAPYVEYWLTPDRVTGQAWASEQADITGLMIDDALFAAGDLWFGKSAPQMSFSAALLRNPIMTHVLVPKLSVARLQAEMAGFSVVYDAGLSYVVLRRKR